MSEQSLDLPAPTVASELPAILGLGPLAVPPVWRDHLNALLGQISIQRIAVIGAVTYESLGESFKVSRCESFMYKGDFVWASRRNVQGERSTKSV